MKRESDSMCFWLDIWNFKIRNHHGAAFTDLLISRFIFSSSNSLRSESRVRKQMQEKEPKKNFRQGNTDR